MKAKELLKRFCPPVLYNLLKKVKTLSGLNKKPVYYCPYIGQSFNFGINYLTHCCVSFNSVGTPYICEFNGGKFPIDQYLKSFKKYTHQNKLQQGECKGCYNLKLGYPISKPLYFTCIYLNNFNKCNLKCNYCQKGRAQWRKKSIKPYSLVPTLQYLYDKKYVRKSTRISWGGGEPTLYEYFDETVEFCLEKQLPQHIDTNATLYSCTIAKILSQGIKSSVRVSVDSGTAETYKKVKGVDCFEEVWKNIKQYNEINRIILKYNIMTENNKDEDIEKFIENCCDAKIKEIDISPELHSYFSSEENIEDKKHCLNSASNLYHKAQSYNIKANLLFWNEEDRKQILDSKGI